MRKISKAQLIKLQKKYKTDKAIGELFGITRQAVHQMRKKYDIGPVEDKYDSRNQEILKLYNEGMPGTKIAQKIKLSVSQTYRIISNASNSKS
ncbi:helix-turn-helix domain-containing protein [Chitinispirillales bacterium ANBcel5]|uniref:helix-turn-helix domain-containing protein n=1 Tax=Cellulosispirillum alkaliphilum TaxID=3039283 RepID=UPI002A547900|nr:helix-turn-helix domain-containing protein [Chitinispirillales bacterium ANBcel5]